VTSRPTAHYGPTLGKRIEYGESDGALARPASSAGRAENPQQFLHLGRQVPWRPWLAAKGKSDRTHRTLGLFRPHVSFDQEQRRTLCQPFSALAKRVDPEMLRHLRMKEHLLRLCGLDRGIMCCPRRGDRGRDCLVLQDAQHAVALLPMRRHLAEILAGVPEDEQARIVGGNAARVYDFDTTRSQARIKASRSELIVSASVVGMPWGKPL